MEAVCRDQLIEDNEKLMYWAVAKAQKKYVQVEYDDLLSAAGLALVKAASRFDGSRGSSFSAFYMFVYNNEILMLLRSKRRELPTISLDAPLSADDGMDIYLRDVVAAQCDTERDAFTNIELAQAMRFMDALTQRQRACLIAALNGIEQIETARTIGSTQSYVSKATRRAHEQLRIAVDTGITPRRRRKCVRNEVCANERI